MRIRQLLVDAQGCAGPLDDPDAIAAALDAAAHAVGANVIASANARYVPHGVTAVVVLAESHIVVSTWPEHRLALVDVLLCNDHMDPMVAWARIERLLKPDRAATQTTWRVVRPSTEPLPIG